MESLVADLVQFTSTIVKFLWLEEILGTRLFLHCTLSILFHSISVQGKNNFLKNHVFKKKELFHEEVLRRFI